MIGRYGTCAIVSLAVTATAAGMDGAPQDAASVPGRALLELRPRYNHIEESDKPLEAEGFTSRVAAGHELRGSNGGLYGLQAPLTDYYAWNGWSLAFFIPPREGLEDRWLTARASLGSVILYAESHRFRSDFGRHDLGRELDVGIAYEARRDLVARLQHPRYDPGSGSADASIRKTWLTVTYTH